MEASPRIEHRRSGQINHHVRVRGHGVSGARADSTPPCAWALAVPSESGQGPIHASQHFSFITVLARKAQSSATRQKLPKITGEALASSV